MDIKPCPMCGGTPRLKVYHVDELPLQYFTEHYSVICVYTGLEQGCGTEGQHNKIKELAIEAWNRRTDG